ncbi:uncharacterized protein OCT59_017233 [Rhizophagus irregularis]|uniref:uncharacterized protein n=1 Tax=Rhizophagus irregularis TaxID=588596 RepID=UPI0019F28E73|nr:hypothetical protein OCT59_017233 [Rhizophagus irregularis]GBC50168.2 hypothetical protein RIR_jg21591.t1 [Rhizophagus irregularis DAOM 181602=DAOM 197198]
MKSMDHIDKEETPSVEKTDITDKEWDILEEYYFGSQELKDLFDERTILQNRLQEVETAYTDLLEKLMNAKKEKAMEIESKKTGSRKTLD